MRTSTDSTEEHKGLYSVILATGTSLHFEIVTDLLPGHQSVFNGWVVVELDWPQHSNPGKYVWVHTQFDKLLLMLMSQEKNLRLNIICPLPFLFSQCLFTASLFLFCHAPLSSLLLLLFMSVLPREEFQGK